MFWLFSLTLAFNLRLGVAQEILLAVDTKQEKNYNLWLKGRDCMSVDIYQGHNASRLSIELVLICKALRLGGLNSPILFKPSANYTRSIVSAEKGYAALSSTSVWRDEIDTDLFYMSPPIFKPGQFVKAFFTTEEKRVGIEQDIAEALAQGKSPLTVLSKFSILTSKKWKHDWAIATKLGIPKNDASESANRCKMLANERGDLYLGELAMVGRFNLAIPCLNKVTLYPIRGVKITFDTARHFIISKKYPNAKQISEALNKGLTLLKASGELDRALYPFPDLKRDIDDWVELNPKFVKN
ncbi:hypothetical protein XM47_01020 [Catenovulum maritimum]|uniref:Solute-binding protein family 3/N-terminal domain-containing protein n=2 Tax=Catenovulum maritimum TaxID=1513271 RepID=A0A0J8GVH0_9ALTE|nr:hypothetical protein XM47_01020 [Catenovulum maritimum]